MFGLLHLAASVLHASLTVTANAIKVKDLDLLGSALMTLLISLYSSRFAYHDGGDDMLIQAVWGEKWIPAFLVCIWLAYTENHIGLSLIIVNK